MQATLILDCVKILKIAAIGFDVEIISKMKDLKLAPIDVDQEKTQYAKMGLVFYLSFKTFVV